MKFRMVVDFDVATNQPLDMDQLRECVENMGESFSEVMESGDFADALLDAISADVPWEGEEPLYVEVSTGAVAIGPR